MVTFPQVKLVTDSFGNQYEVAGRAPPVHTYAELVELGDEARAAQFISSLRLDRFEWSKLLRGLRGTVGDLHRARSFTEALVRLCTTGHLQFYRLPRPDPTDAWANDEGTRYTFFGGSTALPSSSGVDHVPIGSRKEADELLGSLDLADHEVREILAQSGVEPHEIAGNSGEVLAERLSVARILAYVFPSGPKKPKPSPKPTPPKPSPKPTPTTEPKLVSIDYLDGTDLKLGGGFQFVNLPRDAKWVDGTHVKNIDKLSQKPRLKIKFDKPGAHTVKLTHKPASGNAQYKAAEEGRNGNFKKQKDVKSYTTGGDGTLIVPDDFFVTAAGKDKYQVEAKDEHGTTLLSSTIETRRLIHLIELKMTGLASIATGIGVLTGEYAKHGIVISALASKNMPHMPNIGNDADRTTLESRARTAYTGSTAPAKEPYVVAVAYTDHLAVKAANQSVTKSNVQVGPGKPVVAIPIRGPGMTNPAIQSRSLWQQIVPGESWFVSARYKSADGSVDVAIPAAKCSAGSPNASTVRVDVTGLPAGTGTIALRVNWVDRMRAGLAFPGGNLICICTRAWWTNITTQEQNEVMVHELGHMVGMVADGTGKLPDAVPTLYGTPKGHVGNHCHFDRPTGQARYDSNADAAGSKCVMYGQTNSKSAFCSKCAPVVRKLDLSAGWPRF